MITFIYIYLTNTTYLDFSVSLNVLTNDWELKSLSSEIFDNITGRYPVSQSLKVQYGMLFQLGYR